jgi:competence protein ComGC
MVKHSPASSAVAVVIAVSMLVLSVLSLVGLGYLTKYTFSAQRDGDREYVKVTMTERNLARLTVVLLWISVAFSLIASIATVSK